LRRGIEENNIFDVPCLGRGSYVKVRGREGDSRNGQGKKECGQVFGPVLKCEDSSGPGSGNILAKEVDLFIQARNKRLVVIRNDSTSEKEVRGLGEASS